MNKTTLRNFATEARRELREKIIIKAMQLGITEENIKKASVQSSDAIFVDGRQLTLQEGSQRNKLIEEIKTKGYNQVIEEVAYTWFNRFTALRFMEVNDYLPTKVRILSSKNEGSYEPDIIKEALNINLEIDKELVYRLKTSKDNDAIDKLYKYLIIKQCNALNGILPLMFEKIIDYTELLFPDGLLSDGSFLRVMTDKQNIPEDNWKNVEVIGWLYQYYISERKDEVFTGLKKNKKIERNDIAPATQLFTPHWIVRYMVENSVGKLWQEGHPNEELKENWKYYIEEAEQEEKVQKQLDQLKEDSRNIQVEDIKIIDPAMGSGHILVYAFDLLYDIYLSEGYIAHEIPKLIIEKNLYGIDIDERAFQLAYFALMMKGRSRSRRFFSDQVEVNICAIEESNGFPKDAIKYFLSSKSLEMEKHIVEKDLEYLIDIFYDAKEYGSIIKVKNINFDLIERRLKEIRSEAPEDMFELQHRDKILDVIPALVKQGKVLSDKYDALIANPPYMGSRGMNPKLSAFVSKEYPDTKADLFAVFMELDDHMVKPKGYMAMVNQHSWMFLSSFEKYRLKMLGNRTIISMLHLGARAFEEISGEVVQSTTFVNRKVRLREYRGDYIRLVDYNNAGLKERKYLESLGRYDEEYRYISKINDFEKIPGSPISYWTSEIIREIYYNDKKLSKLADTRQGLITGENERFLRYWYEISNKGIWMLGNFNKFEDKMKYKWFKLNKGGPYRKWYGNNEYVVNWKNDGFEIKNFRDDNGKLKSRPQNTDYYFKKGLTWSDICSGKFSLRVSDNSYIFDASGPKMFVKSDDIYNYLNGFFNTKVSNIFIDLIIPTIHYSCGVIGLIPIIQAVKVNKDEIDNIVENSISISRTDWDSFETSWDFKLHPFLKQLDLGEPYKLFAIFSIWETETDEAFNQLKSNEEELNRIFIDIYGLQDELTPEVVDKDITISIANRERDIKSFISYAIGCMFGRYSLDEEGLIYAGGEFDSTKYKLFPADKDNIIPILSDSYFEDDIVSRFVDFVKITFGEDTLNENLKYIAESLGVRANETPRETIRRYFLNDFYKNHTQIYKKRPIYWLFSSGKEKAFNALIYMHRYDSSSLARIRTDYLHVLQSRFDVERQALLDKLDETGITVKETKDYEKELKDLDKKIIELKEYDEVLHHMADKKIEIDLDDGVVVNYAKFEGLVQKI